MKRHIRLTEGQLNRIVLNTAKRLIRESEGCMTKDDIYNSIAELAQSQGFYGRLLNAIDERPEILDEIESWGCKDTVDLVMALEG